MISFADAWNEVNSRLIVLRCERRRNFMRHAIINYENGSYQSYFPRERCDCIRALERRRSLFPE